MIDHEVEIIVDCDGCDKKLKESNHDINVFCDDCINQVRSQEMIEIMKEILSHKEWENYDGIGYESDKEKKMFMEGIKYGMEHALFSYADHYCGDEGIELFEEIAGWVKNNE